MGEPRFLVISDLHLGEDLGRSIRTTEDLEDALIGFLDHHREHGGPWRLVIDGDMLELVGVVVLPGDHLVAGELHPHDRRYGLGGREEAAAIKMREMVDHHAAVFAAMGRFVAAGHRIEIVIGNHDVELHWPAVQEAFVGGVVREQPAPDALREAIGFHDWFLYEPGVVWIEHGHQYDAYCSFTHPLAPAIDRVEVDPNIGGLLLRYLGSQFGDDVHGVVHRGTLAYLRLWASRGPLHMSRIFVAYFDMCRRLVEHWRGLDPARRAAHATLVEQRLDALAAASGVRRAQLDRLAALWRPPVANRLGDLLRGLMFDRVALLVAAPLALAAILAAPAESRLTVCLLLTPAVGLLAAASATAREPTDPRRAMRRRAAAIRRIVDVRWVVMGHSHDPEHTLEDDGGYLNTGTWAPRGDPHDAFTHVRIEGARAALRQWRDGASRCFEPASARGGELGEAVVDVAPV